MTGVPEVLRLAEVADMARALGAVSFKQWLGASFVLVGSEHEPEEQGAKWSYSTARHAAHGAVPVTALETAIVIPVKKARPDFFPGVVLVGRASSNDICLDSASVSKLHARLHESPDGLAISDADSRNGTLLNGKPVVGDMAVRVFSVVTFGRRSFTVQDVPSLHSFLRKMPG